MKVSLVGSGLLPAPPSAQPAQSGQQHQPVEPGGGGDSSIYLRSLVSQPPFTCWFSLASDSILNQHRIQFTLLILPRRYEFLREREKKNSCTYSTLWIRAFVEPTYKPNPFRSSSLQVSYRTRHFDRIKNRLLSIQVRRIGKKKVFLKNPRWVINHTVFVLKFLQKNTFKNSPPWHLINQFLLENLEKKISQIISKQKL